MSAAPAVTSSAQPTPERIMQMIWGFTLPLILQTAVRTGIFDSLQKEPATTGELAQRLGLQQRGTRMVVDTLIGMQFLTIDAASRLHCAPEASMFLVSTSPASLSGLVSRISPRMTESWQALEETVRTGATAAPVNQQGPGVAFFQQLVKDIFPMSFKAARDLAGHLALTGSGPRVSVLDIAAGSGVWGIALGMDAPRVHVTAVDWADVLPVTQEYAGRFGMADRLKVVAGDILVADLGSGHHIATLGHILHSEGVARSRELLRRVSAAMAKGGTIVIAEFLLDENRHGPMSSLIFGINMLVNTEHGEVYSAQQIGAWLAECGFGPVRMLHAPGPSPLLLATKL